MALATRCPACTTVFRIGTAQAAAKGGMVRCGVCRNVFNSLDALVRVEDLDVVEEVILQAPVSPRPASAEPAMPEPPLSAAETAPSPQVPTAASVEADVASMDADVASTGAPTASAPTGTDAADEPPAPVTQSPPADEQAIIREWWLPVDEPVDRGVPGADPEPVLVETAEDALAPSTSGRRGPRSEPSPVDGTNPVFMRPTRTADPASRAWRWLLGVLSLIAAIALIAQFAYLWRDELAVRWPPARPWLAATCSALGCTVGYPAHPESITIESATVQTVAANANVYVLSALLRNRDSIDLRYPTLELVLTDLQDRPILRRDFRPADYLVGVPGHSPSSGFPAQSELSVRITFELADLHFAGYRLTQFYP